MKMLKSNADTLDRLSALPDSLILEILSLLKMRAVVRTTLLSKRWKYLWITIPCLQFKERGDPVKVRNFVSRVLTLWKGTHLRKFSIDFSGGSDLSLCSDVDLWVLFANERKVEELCILYQFSGFGPFYCPSQCLYECSSIRKLLLYGCSLQIRGDVQWNRLNSLVLHSCYLPDDDDVFDKVFASSTQLETVTLRLGHIKEEENLSIHSSSLKKLTVFSHSSDLSVMTIWAPNLEEWKFKGGPFTKYLLTNVSSLTKVHLDFWDIGTPSVEETLLPLLPAIQHVVTVELAYNCVEMLGYMIRGKYPFSPLLNVKSLRVGESLQISKLVALLGIFPKLKTLIIDWDENDDQYPYKFNAENFTMSEANILNSYLLQLRTLVIIWNFYEDSIFQFIEFLLKHANLIKKIVIEKREYEAVDSEDLFLAAQKVVSLQRSFPSAEFIICKNSKKYFFSNTF